MIRRPPRSTPTDTLFPYTTLFRSHFRVEVEAAGGEAARTDDLEHRERHFLDRIGELIGVPAILVIAAVGVDRPENAEGGGGGDLMLEGMARQRSEEHTSELQSLMRISYAVFCLKKKKSRTKQ